MVLHSPDLVPGVYRLCPLRVRTSATAVEASEAGSTGFRPTLRQNGILSTSQPDCDASGYESTPSGYGNLGAGVIPSSNIAMTLPAVQVAMPITVLSGRSPKYRLMCRRQRLPTSRSQ